MMADPLEDLIVDDEAIARETLAKLLAPYLGITKTGDLVLTERVETLTAARRVLVVLLGAWAAHLIGLRPKPGASPTELVDLSGLPSGTVRPKLSELSKRRLVSKRGPDYVVPTTSVRLAATEIEGGRAGMLRRRAS